MKVIAVTGGIACGKTTLLEALKSHGARVIDSDAISRSLTAPGGMALPAILDAFGPAVFAPDGALDRKALADIVFSDGQKRKALNAIVHPLVETEIKRQSALYRAAGEKLIFLDIPLLFEAGMAHLCDESWCAYLNPDEQLKRLMARDRLTREQALARIQSQMPVAEKARRCDKVIDTSGTLAQTAQKAVTLYQNALNDS